MLMSKSLKRMRASIQPTLNYFGNETDEEKHNKNAAKNFSKCFFERICTQPRNAGSAPDSYANLFFFFFNFLKIFLVPLNFEVFYKTESVPCQ